MATAFASAPEQGQLVSVRSRNWIVNEVVPSTLPTTGLQGVSDPQTLVSLASVEDDGLGEEIQVVWELEPDTRVKNEVASSCPWQPLNWLGRRLDLELSHPVDRGTGSDPVMEHACRSAFDQADRP